MEKAIRWRVLCCCCWCCIRARTMYVIIFGVNIGHLCSFVCIYTIFHLLLLLLLPFAEFIRFHPSYALNPPTDCASVSGEICFLFLRFYVVRYVTAMRYLFHRGAADFATKSICHRSYQNERENSVKRRTSEPIFITQVHGAFESKECWKWNLIFPFFLYFVHYVDAIKEVFFWSLGAPSTAKVKRDNFEP